MGLKSYMHLTMTLRRLLPIFLQCHVGNGRSRAALHSLLEIPTPRPCSGSGLRYFKLSANRANRSFLDLSVTRHAGDFAACAVEPDGMSATLPVEDAAVLPEMPLQVRQHHVPANSIVSRKACGESSFSASSRWHSRTSFKASRRFALASSMVSPCEIAAGISSTKQVYPPSLAGSRTAVSFMLANYHADVPSCKRQLSHLNSRRPRTSTLRWQPRHPRVTRPPIHLKSQATSGARVDTFRRSLPFIVVVRSRFNVLTF